MHPLNNEVIYANTKYKRLTLRKLINNDIPTLYNSIFNDTNVIKHTFGKEKISLENLKEYLTNIGLAVLEKSNTKELIGLAGILPCSYLGEEDYEFGFILAQKYWGKGYATEIGKAQIEHIKNTLKKPRALAIVHPQNYKQTRFKTYPLYRSRGKRN